MTSSKVFCLFLKVCDLNMSFKVTLCIFEFPIKHYFCLKMQVRDYLLDFGRLNLNYHGTMKQHWVFSHSLKFD